MPNPPKKNPQASAVASRFPLTQDWAPVRRDPLQPLNLKRNSLNSVRQVAGDSDEKIAIHDSAGIKSGNYSKKRVASVVKAAKAVGADPYAAAALALQETSFNTHEKDTRPNASRRNRSSLGTISPDMFEPEELDEIDRISSEGGLERDAVALAMALKKKVAYGKSLGYTDPAMQLQAYNGYGTITPAHFGGATKAYGVDITGGVSMKKNPLYGKRLLQLSEDMKKNKEIAALLN